MAALEDVSLFVVLLTPGVSEVLISGLVREGFVVRRGQPEKAEHTCPGEYSAICYLILKDVFYVGNLTPTVRVIQAAKRALETYCYFGMFAVSGASAWTNESMPTPPAPEVPVAATVAEDRAILDEDVV